jgi:demethylmenaquinone methyltransferase/2-methoxy-6-polyprenyl-1,4-benzoquinol methylase
MSSPRSKGASQTAIRAKPDRAAALARYRLRASRYDLELAPFEPVRRRAIAALAPQLGDHVLDLGSGTGLSLFLLREAVGEKGRICGVEQCPEMLALARERVADAGWKNVDLICTPVEDADLHGRWDGALLHFTHDILRGRPAVDKLLKHLRPGARVVATGLTWAPVWAWPVNLFVWGAALYSVSSLEGLDAPWSHLATRLTDFEVDTTLLGGVFVATGIVPPR